MLYWLGRTFSLIILKAFYRFIVTGQENIPASGGALVACTHQSFADTLIAGVAMRPRKVCFMARKTLCKNPFFGWVLRSVNAFPVNRGEVDAEAVKAAIEKLRSGQVLLVFPEGTRTADGSFGEIRSGTAMIASRAGVPVLPMVVHGMYEAWPRHQKYPGPGRVSVAIGEPVPPPSGNRAERQAATELLARRWQELKANLVQAGQAKAG